MADPLALLQRLRGIEVARAQSALAAARRQAEAAALAALAAAEAIPAQQAAGDRGALGQPMGADYAAWLPRGVARRDRLAQEARRAELVAETAHQALTQARIADRAVELLREHRAAEAARTAARREQAAMDDHAGRR
jgi:flagellar export protein FliJ